MGLNNNLTVIGNITRDPELRFTSGGMAVASFGLAWNKRKQNRQTGEWDEEVNFFDVTIFGQMAENCAESLTKGTRVVVAGELRQSSWQTQEGDKRSKVEIIADEVAPSLRWATTSITRNERREGGGNFGGGGGSAPAPTPIPNQPPTGYDMDEEPF